MRVRAGECPSVFVRVSPSAQVARPAPAAASLPTPSRPLVLTTFLRLPFYTSLNHLFDPSKSKKNQSQQAFPRRKKRNWFRFRLFWQREGGSTTLSRLQILAGQSFPPSCPTGQSGAQNHVFGHSALRPCPVPVRPCFVRIRPAIFGRGTAFNRSPHLQRCISVLDHPFGLYYPGRKPQAVGDGSSRPESL